MIERLIAEIDKIWGAIGRLQTQDSPRWVYLSSPLTSTSWDGDSYSTTAKTLIDLSTVFNAPPNIKAGLIFMACRDSAAATNDALLVLSPNNVAYKGAQLQIIGGFNDYYYSQMVIIPCDSNGDIYYQTTATGVNTLDVVIEIWGYLI